MSKKEKEEDRIERIIRGLLKLPENRRCINCNSLGPQYVCTTFLTFVCTNCSGVHREFTHRVKSVSMAKFSAEEVSALQAAGNERARQIYFKDWDSQRNSYPDGSNLHKLRDFIKHVYVDRKYSGERNHEKLSKLRLSNMEETCESRNPHGFRSPNYEDRRERSETFSAGGLSECRRYCEERSPRYSLEHPRYGGFKKSSAHFEVVDDRFRDDRVHSGGRQPNGNRLLHRDSRASSSFPDHHKNMNRSSSPVLRSLRNILGEHASPVPVDEQSKATDGSALNQSVVHVGSMESKDCNPMEHKGQHSAVGLIDWNTELKPSDDAAAAPKKQESTNGGNSSSHESSTKENAPSAPKPNALEFLIHELSGPLVAGGGVSEVPSNANPSIASRGNMPISSDVSGISSAVPPGQIIPNGTGTSDITSGGSTSVSSASPAVLAGQMLKLSSSAGASTNAAVGNKPAGSIASAATVGQVSKSTDGACSSPAGLTSTSSNGAGLSLAGPMATSLDSVGNSAAGTEESMPSSGIPPGLLVEQTLSLHNNFDCSMTSSNTNLPMQLYNGGPPQAAALVNSDPIHKFPNGQEASSMQQQEPSLSSLTDASSVGQHAPTIPVNQLPTSINVSNARASQDVSNLTEDSDSGIRSQPHPAKTNSDRRKELPADLFTASYSPFPGPVTGWQIGPSYGMGYGTQYHPNTMHVPAYATPGKSTNPFDLNSETTPAQAPAFPSVANLHGALPNMSAPGFLAHTFSIGRDSPGSIPTQSPSYLSAMHLGSPSIASTMSSGQQVMNMPPSRQQADAGIGGNGVTFGSLNTAQQPTSGYSLNSPPSSFPSNGGNPFG